MSEKLKALSLTQPWASLIAMEEKRYETRSWGNYYRGPLAIHAAKNLAPVGGPSGLGDLLTTNPFFKVIGQHVLHSGEQLPLGAIVAVCDLVAITCMTAHPYPGDLPGSAVHELSFGDFSGGRYAWRLQNVRVLSKPVPARGRQGLWDVESPLLCLNCGTITLSESWGYFQRNDPDGEDYDERHGDWRPSLPGEGDPMARCPSCSWEHEDTDGNPGIMDEYGPLALLALDEERVKLEPEYRDQWADAVAVAT
ncbi:MAG TPA: ASCH domain-containing protein [Gaiellaceae bacterium]|nr:ASCH domain-containing protein [Gaiellaceae bacterium]